MKNGDVTLQTIILAGHCLLVKIITLEPNHIFWSNFAYLYIFWNWQRKWQRKEKKNRHAWIRTTVHQAVGLQESIVDHLAWDHVLYILLEQFNYISFTCARQFKLHNPCVRTILQDPWVRTILHDPLVCTIITMWVRPSVCGQVVKMLIKGSARYCSWLHVLVTYKNLRWIPKYISLSVLKTSQF